MPSPRQPRTLAPSGVLVRVATPEAMRTLGAALGAVAEPGDRLLLEGSFGAGKTTFVQGLARGLGVAEPVGSPSFVLENQYRGRLPLYHVDLYRLDRLDPAFADELAEHLLGDGVSAVEWPALLPADLRAGAAVLRFSVEAHRARTVRVDDPRGRLADAARAIAARLDAPR